MLLGILAVVGVPAPRAATVTGAPRVPWAVAWDGLGEALRTLDATSFAAWEPRGGLVIRANDGLSPRLHRVTEPEASPETLALPERVVHRDVKPANVFVRRSDASGWHSTLLDFGLCKASDDATALTAQGVLLGTPGYMAPEQIRGEAVDARADLYAVACIVVEMLGGRPAFRGPRREDILAAQLAGDLAPLPAAIPAVAREALQRALSVEPDRRPRSAVELRQALLATSLARTHVAAVADARPRSGGRRRYLLGAVSVVAFAVGILLVEGSRSEEGVRVDEVESKPANADGDRRQPTSAPTPSPPEAPAVVVEPIASMPIASEPVATAPVPAPSTKPSRRHRPRPERDIEEPEPVAPPRPESKPKRPLVDGIRDPFAD